MGLRRHTTSTSRGDQEEGARPPPTPFRTGPGPGGIHATLNIRVACNTTGFATSDFLTLQVPDGWNGIDTIVTLASNSGANSNYYNESRIVSFPMVNDECAKNVEKSPPARGAGAFDGFE